MAKNGQAKLHPEGLTQSQEDLITKLFDIGAIKFGNFKFKLHDKYPDAPLSPLYCDLRVPRRFPEIKRMIVDAYMQLLRPLKFDLLADVPTAATSYVAILSDRLGIGMVTPRVDTKKHGTGAKIDGLLKEDRGKRAVLIDDLITRADSKFETIAVLKEHRIRVKDVVVLLDRNEGGRKQLAHKGYNLHKAFTLDQMLKFYLRTGRITQETYESTLSGLKDMISYVESKQNKKSMTN